MDITLVEKIYRADGGITTLTETDTKKSLLNIASYYIPTQHFEHLKTHGFTLFYDPQGNYLRELYFEPKPGHD